MTNWINPTRRNRYKNNWKK